MFLKQWKGRKGRLKDPFKMGWLGCVCSRRKSDNHNQHLLWLLGHLPLGYWHGQLDLLFALAHSPKSWPFPLASHPLKVYTNLKGSFVTGKGRCAPGLVHTSWHCPAPWITRGIHSLGNQGIALWHHAKRNGTDRTTTRRGNEFKPSLDSKRRGQKWRLWIHKP